jgi:protein gp37
MAQKSSIQWTTASWNPIRGCSRISPGCGGAKGEGGCYAEVIASRFCGPGQAFDGFARRGPQGGRWTGKVSLLPGHLEDTIRWKKPTTFFVNSTSDLFHERLTNEEIAAVFGVMSSTPRHTYQVLTKRAKRMREWFRWISALSDGNGPPPAVTAETCASNYCDLDQLGSSPWPLQNVWIGVSVENQACADERVPHLLACPAAVRWLSIEPQLEDIELSPHWLGDICSECSRKPTDHLTNECPAGMLRRGVVWIVQGGESGHGARAFNPVWARNIRRQCAAACDCRYFFKQFGSNVLSLDGTKFRDSHGGDPSEWPEEFRVREFPVS